MTKIIIFSYASSLWIYGPYAAAPITFPSRFGLLWPRFFCGIRCPLASWSRKAKERVSIQEQLGIIFRSWRFLHCWKWCTCSIFLWFSRNLLLGPSHLTISASRRWTFSWIRASPPKWFLRSNLKASPASLLKKILFCKDRRLFPSWCLCLRSSSMLHHIFFTFSD